MSWSDFFGEIQLHRRTRHTVCSTFCLCASVTLWADGHVAYVLSSGCCAYRFGVLDYTRALTLELIRMAQVFSPLSVPLEAADNGETDFFPILQTVSVCVWGLLRGTTFQFSDLKVESINFKGIMWKIISHDTDNSQLRGHVWIFQRIPAFIPFFAPKICDCKESD